MRPKTKTDPRIAKRMKLLGSQIRRLRAGRSVTALAAEAGIGYQTWYAMERGKPVENRTILKALDVLDRKLVIVKGKQ